MIFDQVGLPKILQSGKNMGFLVCFANSGKRKVAALRDF